MTYLSSTCLYCFNNKQITAEKTKWLIHLAQHREEIIRQLSDDSTSCVLCAYSVDFANKKHASSHYRWGHKKSEIIDWALQTLPIKILA